MLAQQKCSYASRVPIARGAAPTTSGAAAFWRDRPTQSADRWSAFKLAFDRHFSACSISASLLSISKPFST